MLLEEDCHKLDMTMHIDGGSGGPSFDKYSAIMEEQRKLKDQVHSLKADLDVSQQLLTQALTTTGMVSGVSVSCTTSPLLLQIVSAIQTTRGKIQDLQSEINKLEATKNKFHTEEGPFAKALDDALASFNVQRQAYYSGSFVGNHVHRALKV